ncbi:translational machinery component [Ganoderma leucocontextum]|nr:translational machinery component [Ganoderma leucocontextum]
MPEYFDNLLKDVHGPIAESNEAVASPPVEEDLPPAPPADSFPRNPAYANPVTIARKSSVAALRSIYSVSVKSSRNNTIITFARPNGTQLLTLTGGKLGFKKSNRNGYEAGYQCAVGIIAAMEEELRRTDFDWKLYLNGFGQGRDAMLTALTTAVGDGVKQKLKRITDRTPLKIGGTRGMKTRRV